MDVSGEENIEFHSQSTIHNPQFAIYMENCIQLNKSLYKIRLFTKMKMYKMWKQKIAPKSLDWKWI